MSHTPYSKFNPPSVVTLSPGKVAVLDVDSYRAIAVVPAWPDSFPSMWFMKIYLRS